MATACFTGLPAAISALTFLENAFLLVLFINGIVLFILSLDQLVALEPLPVPWLQRMLAVWLTVGLHLH